MENDPIEEFLTDIAERLGADAVGIAVIRTNGKAGYATIAVHEDGKPADPALFGRLSDELYKCALQAATAATHGEKHAS